MKNLFSENNFFGNTCSLISHVDISEIKRRKGAVTVLFFFLELSSIANQKKNTRDVSAGNIKKKQNKEFTIVDCRRCV